MDNLSQDIEQILDTHNVTRYSRDVSTGKETDLRTPLTSALTQLFNKRLEAELEELVDCDFDGGESLYRNVYDRIAQLKEAQQ